MSFLTWLFSSRCEDCGRVDASVREYGYADWKMCQDCRDDDITGEKLRRDSAAQERELRNAHKRVAARRRASR